MSILYVLVPLAVLMSGGAVALFAWATRRGQFDDLETPALRILVDDIGGPKEPASAKNLPESGGSTPNAGPALR